MTIASDPPATSFEELPEDWSRALAVVAHPDDLEYGAASAVARWTDQGKTVVYVMVTAGEAGIDSIPPDDAAAMRSDEQIRAGREVGVDVVEFLGHPDGLLEASIGLRRDLAGAIRRYRPDVLVSLNHREFFPFGGYNHVDHRVVGTALLDAARDAANRWLFPGVGGAPWSGVRFAVFANSPRANSFVDIAATVERGVASLAAHDGYLAVLPDGTAGKDPGPFIRGMAASAGEAVGREAAVLFERIDL
ncbi:MAG: PIG-L deacetylase family protein [Microthrixaceae bacterium]